MALLQCIRVALYARVSTSRQETENQLAVLREFCTRNQYDIVRTYVDEVSGSGMKVRNQFNTMLNEARTRQFDLVLFWSLDRFTREGALKTLQYLQQLTSYGVGYKSYTEQYLDSAGVFSDAIIAIIATLAKQERLRIQERVKAGLARLQSTLNSIRVGVGSCTTTDPNCALFRLDRTNTSFAAGAGAQVKFGPWAVRAEYERFNAAGGNPSLVSLGLTWTFL